VVKVIGEWKMIKAINTHLKQYISIFAGSLQYIAGQAYGWAKKGKETGGPLLGLRTHAGRFVLMLAAPGGPNTCHERARFAMDPDYVTWLNQYMLDNFGLQYIGDWHLHVIDMDHASGGDVNHIHRLAGRENLEAMVQLVLTRQKVTDPNQQPVRFNSIKERRTGNQDNHAKIRVNAFIYEKAANGPYLRCAIKIMPGKSAIRKVLADTGILDIPGRPVFRDLPLEKIIYDEVRSLPGTATEQYIPYILTKQLNELSDEIAQQTEICTYDEGRIVLSLPLSNSRRVSITYTGKESPPRIRSVNVFFPDTKAAIDITKDVLMGDDYALLSLIHRLVEDKVRGSKIKRLTPFICGCQYLTSRFHKSKKI